MQKIRAIDTRASSFVIDESLNVEAVERKPGEPERLPGMTLGIVEMERDAPHGGEVHPDGDELLCILSGRVRADELLTHPTSAATKLGQPEARESSMTRAPGMKTPDPPETDGPGAGNRGRPLAAAAVSC